MSNNPENRLTPTPPTVWQLQAEIALLREIVYQMTQTLEAQVAYTERLDDLWRQHLLEAAAGDVYTAFLGKDEPDAYDVWEVDQWKTDLTLTYRTEP